MPTVIVPPILIVVRILCISSANTAANIMQNSSLGLAFRHSELISNQQKQTSELKETEFDTGRAGG